jgi:hypothetical protein
MRSSRIATAVLAAVTWLSTAAAAAQQPSPVADQLMEERAALETLQRLALDGPQPAVPGKGSASQRAISELRARIGADAAGMLKDWQRQQGPREVFAWSLTKLARVLEWAIREEDVAVVRAVADDLAVKRLDCDARPERRFGEVRISIRTLANNIERHGLQLRYIEGFYFPLLQKRPELASQWREFSRVSAIVDEPLPAGDYMVVAWADGKPVSDPKPISVGLKFSTRFDIVLR